MAFINLDIKARFKCNTKTPTLLSEAIERDRFVVVLGAPGSGKSSILSKYKQEHSHVELTTVKRLLKLKKPLNDHTTIILIDGLDEYRSVEADKAFVVEELAEYIKNIANSVKIILSCREMDWYGELDEKALKDTLQEDVKLYSIQTLSNEKKIELSTTLGISNPTAFVKQFDNFLDNPQMLYMMCEMYKEDSQLSITNKTDLYHKFIDYAREKNPVNTRNNVHNLEASQFIRCAGYLAFYCMFSDIEQFGDDFLDKVAHESKSFSKEKLTSCLNSNLFNDKNFCHRTLTEFCLAHFIQQEMLENEVGVSLNRIINVFVNKHNKIPTDLRGTYAWLSSLTKNEVLIDVDPYYQAIHGDNTLYSPELKKNVILAVKEHAQTNPYFINFWQKNELEGFYGSDLDSFLIKEIKGCLNRKNHYPHFLCTIVGQAKNVSAEVRPSLKELITSSELSCHLKSELLPVFAKDDEFLQDLLERIKVQSIADSNDLLKDFLLKQLYPGKIYINEAIQFIPMFANDIIGRCNFLDKTPEDDKFEVIDKLHQLQNNLEANKKELPSTVKHHIEDYFIDVVKSYDHQLSEKAIYKILKHFRQYYKDYEEIRIPSNRTDNNNELSKDLLKNLSQKLFELYIDDLLDSKVIDFSSIYNFKHFFPVHFPENATATLLQEMSEEYEREINQALLHSALVYDRHHPLIESKAKHFGFEPLYHEWLNPEKPQWQIDDERRDAKQLNEEKKKLEENEAHFTAKTDDQILETFGDLVFAHKFVYFTEYDPELKLLTKETLSRLKGILKRLVTEEYIIDTTLMNLTSLVKNGSNRYIDSVYFSACTLTNDTTNFKNDDFFQYLYINCVLHGEICNVRDSDFVAIYEKSNLEKCLNATRQYTLLLLNKCSSDIKGLLSSYISQETSLEKLKKIATPTVLDGQKLSDVILFAYLKKDLANALKSSNLSKISLENLDEWCKYTIEAITYIKEGQEENFSVNHAIQIHQLLSYNYESIHELDSGLKVRMLSYMMSQFHTADSIGLKNGYRSQKDSCADFLRSNVLSILSVKELKLLTKMRSAYDDVWTIKILHQINETEQKEADGNREPISLDKIKDFIFSKAILNTDDFFADICSKIDALKKEIEDNRNNDRQAFFNEDKTWKKEEPCRDIILQRLMDKYGYNLELTKEKYEADNRVDINIKYKGDLSFEVQTECKLDQNSGINEGISKQLIEKYFSSEVQHGIYLVFYFGKLKDRSLMEQKINADLPDEYKDKIKVIIIDFVK